MALDTASIDRLAGDRELWRDFTALCDCGGRLAGTESEKRAIELLARRGAAASGQAAARLPVSYGGWHAEECTLELLDDGAALPCHPLVRTKATPPEGLTAEVVDLGRGAPEDFAAQAAAIPGRIVLVRHEYMFAPEHIHRRRKYGWARERGAAGFIIASPHPDGGPVAGSSGRDGAEGIPAIGTDFAAAARLAGGAGGRKRVRLRIATREAPAGSETLVFDIPGESAERVVLSAHLDGHDLAESAIDNASGAAVALAVTRALAPRVARFRRGLRLCFFSVEEWALTGSRHYVGGLAQAERDRLVLDVNLDSVAGSPRLTALSSGFAGLEPFLSGVARSCGQALGLYRPLMANSDHANFAQAGIPALRLVAGFGEPASKLRHVLTPADTRDKATPGELAAAAILTAAIVAEACEASQETVRAFREPD